MSRIISACLFVALPAAHALADEIEVLPGQWSYEVAAVMGGVPINESGVDCVSPGQSKRSLGRTAEAFGNGCAIRQTSPIEGGYAFTLACSGPLRGEVEGEIVTDGTRAVLSGEGWAGAPENPVTITGSAERLDAACG